MLGIDLVTSGIDYSACEAICQVFMGYTKIIPALSASNFYQSQIICHYPVFIVGIILYTL